jgi:hypothetical protein
MNAQKTATDQRIISFSDPWATWLNLYHVLHAWQVEWCHIWGQHCLPSFYRPHRHEGHHQLELPDPLVSTAEPELFA